MSDLGTSEFIDLTEIGRGGFGVVYTAHQPAFDRTVAVKVLTLTDDRTLRRFDRERQALGKVSNHPHITPVFASGFTAEGMPYLAMELMRGGSLADRLEQQGAMPWTEVLDLGVKLAGALETAHRAGILHRDIKPANILLSDFNEPRLADFGIASLDDGEQTKTGVITASVAYAAPEVLDGRRPGVSADVYGLGATLFTLVAGAPPFSVSGEESILAMVLRVARDPVPDLRDQGVPAAFAAALERSMAKKEDDRFHTAEELGAALREAQGELGIRQTAMVLPRSADTAEHAGPPNQTISISPPFVTGQVSPATPDAGEASGTDAAAPASPPAAPTPAEPAWPAPPPAATTPPATAHPPAPRQQDQPPPMPGAVADAGDRSSGSRTGLLVGVGAIVVLLIGILGVQLLGGGTDDDVVTVATTDPVGDATADAPLVAEDPVPADVPAPTAAAEDQPVAPGQSEAVAPVSPQAEDTEEITGAVTPGDWISVRPMSVARQQIPAVSLRGRIWVTGGLAEDGVTASVEGYEAATNSWRSAADLPVPVHHHMAVAYRGELVVLGGWSPQGSLVSAITQDRVMALRGNAWVDLPPLLQPRVAGAAVAIGDLLVVTGGQALDGNLLETTEVFDGETWREVTPMPTPREHLAATTDGTYMYVVGGRVLSADANLSTVERYDPASDTWQEMPDMPTARGGLAAVVIGDSLVALGGERALGVFEEVEAYSFTEGTWTSWPALPTPRHGLGAGVASSTLFVVGGALEPTHSAPTAQSDAVGFNR